MDDDDFKMQIKQCGITDFVMKDEIDLFEAEITVANYDRINAFYKWEQKGYQQDRKYRKVILIKREPINGRFTTKHPRPMISITQRMNEIYREKAKPEDYYIQYYAIKLK